MIDLFRMLAALQRQRSEIADEAIAEIIRIHAYNRKLVEHGVRIKRVLVESSLMDSTSGLSLEKTKEVTAEVLKMFQEDGQ